VGGLGKIVHSAELAEHWRGRFGNETAMDSWTETFVGRFIVDEECDGSQMKFVWAMTDMGHGSWLLLSFKAIAPTLSTHHDKGNDMPSLLVVFCRIYTLRSYISTRVCKAKIFQTMFIQPFSDKFHPLMQSLTNCKTSFLLPYPWWGIWLDQQTTDGWFWEVYQINE